MSVAFLLSVYILSYYPLWLSVCFIDIKSIYIDENSAIWTERIGLVSIGVLVILCYCITKSEIKRKKGIAQSYCYSLLEVKEQKATVMEYVFTSVLPLLAFDFTTWSGCILFMIFFSFLCVLSVKHNNLNANIILDFSGYYMYECRLKLGEEDDIKTCILSSDRNLFDRKGEIIYLKTLNSEVRLDMGIKEIE